VAVEGQGEGGPLAGVVVVEEEALDQLALPDGRVPEEDDLRGVTVGDGG
jgi:hypothetical protein